LELLRRALRLAHDRQLLPTVVMLKEDNARQGFFERPDLEAVIFHLPEYVHE